MHNRQTEDVAQHSHQTAVLAHALGLIDKEVFQKKTCPDKCAAIALYHETAEVLTGDMPTPVKYRNAQMREAFFEAEKHAEQRLLDGLPEILKKGVAARVRPEKCREAELAAFADKLAAYIKCTEEFSAGNKEFAAALKTAEKQIASFNDETVNYFMQSFAPSFSMSLDELME